MMMLSTALERPLQFRTVPQFQPGDLVQRRTTHDSVVCEVVRVEADGRLRLRCLAWPVGFSAVVPPEQVTPMNASLFAPSAANFT
jgi:hypothetical protein